MDSGCFACEGTGPELGRERARHWLVPRPACEAHARAGHLEAGATLASLLQESWPEGLDGAGANLLLNPLRLDDRRAWLDVTSRGRAVVEELFPAADYFEFAALHLPAFVDVLYELRDLAPFTHREPLGVMAALGVDNARFTAMQALLGLWAACRTLRRVMERSGSGAPRTLADAGRLWSEARAGLSASEPDPDQLRLFLMALLPLTGRRFAHLGAARA